MNLQIDEGSVADPIAFVTAFAVGPQAHSARVLAELELIQSSADAVSDLGLEVLANDGDRRLWHQLLDVVEKLMETDLSGFDVVEDDGLSFAEQLEAEVEDLLRTAYPQS